MDSKWLKGCTTPEERQARLTKISSYNKAFKELAPMLESKMKHPLTKDYTDPSWPYYRADMDGYNRALTEVLSLLNIKE
ncbi:MAG: hypothetical protein JKY50_00080 [Oleispira sp.]|nr:hypothetical protein [Oleispira sp.]